MSSLIDRFSQNAEGRGSGSTNYFKLKEGESAVLRFLSPMVDNYVVSHASVGCACHIEIPKHDWDAQRAQTGQNPLCPACEQPFADTDIVGMKEGARGGAFHFVQGSGYLLCLDDPDNNQPYQCPLCQMMVEKTKWGTNEKYMAPNVPQDRMLGYAVVRTINKVKGTDGRGMPTEEIGDIADEMIESNGVAIPNVVLVDQAWSNFWSALTYKYDDFRDPITYYDWEVSRTGRNTYTLTKVGRPAEIIDLAKYEPFMKHTLAERVAYKGSPATYTSKGIMVPGYTPEGGGVPGYTPSGLAGGAQNTLNAAAQPMAQPYSAPMAQPYAAPAANPFQGVPAQVPSQAQQPYAAQPTQMAPAAAPVAQPATAPAPQQMAPQMAPQQAATTFMPQPVGAQPAAAQPMAQPVSQPVAAQPQGAPAATVPWTDTAASVGASVYDGDTPF